jgi:hypothetical protein
MSEKRRNSMAVIDQTLIDSQREPEKSNAVDDNLKSTVIAAPVPDEDEDTQPLTADEQQIKDAQEDLLGEEEAEQQRAEIDEEIARQQTTIGKIGNLKNQASEKYGDYLRAGNQYVSGLPTPGGIATPLIILIIFLFILIQIGGHTRLQWLWLVLTNNAFVGGGSNTSTSSTSTSTTNGAFGTFGNTNNQQNTSNQQNSIALPQQPTTPIYPSGTGSLTDVVQPAGFGGGIALAPSTHFNTSFNGSGTVENWL